MGCFILLASAISPRLALGLVWIFTDFVDRAYTSFIVPFLGLLVLPWTTLMYALAYKPVTGVSGWGFFFVVIGFCADIASYGGSAASNKARVSSFRQVY